MIKQIIASTLLTLSTPTIYQKPNVRLNQSQNYSLTINQSEKIARQIKSINDDDNVIENTYERYDFYNEQTYILVNGNAYTQTTNYIEFENQTPNNISQRIATELYNDDWENDNLNYDVCNQLLAIEITPYLINQNTNLTFNLNFSFAVSSNISYNNIMCEIAVYTSTENWSKYIDMTTFSSRPLYTIQKELKDPQYSYNMQIATSKIQMNKSGYNYIGTKQQQIVLSAEKTTYIMAFCIPYIPNQLENYFEDVSYSLTNQTQIGFTNNQLVLTGTYLIPSGDQEIVNIPGMMFDIVTLPFSFISIAFNLTIFPGTPYAVNISNLLLSILGILIFVFLMKLLIGLAGKL